MVLLRLFKSEFHESYVIGCCGRLFAVVDITLTTNKALVQWVGQRDNLNRQT